MKTAKSLLAAALLIATAGFATGCSGPEGTYKLDKEEMKKAMQAELDKKSDEEKGMGELAMALIEAMDMTLELKSGGELEMKASAPSLKEDEKGKEEVEKGTWSADGNTVTLKTDKDEIKCTLESSKLSCESDKDGPALVFNKS